MLTVIKLTWFPEKKKHKQLVTLWPRRQSHVKTEKKKKREKKNDRVKQETLTDSQRETRLYALYLHNSWAQMEPDVIDEFATETCDCCASNSGGRNVPSGISTRFMSILAGRQEKNKYHGATAEKKKLKNRKTAEGKKSKTGKEIDPSMLKRK